VHVNQAEVEHFKILENLFALLQHASDDSTTPAAAQQNEFNAIQLPNGRLGK
jgi:hypothetical protein